MFGKPRDIDDIDTIDPNGIDGFFGDETAAEAIVELHELQRRVEHVESQVTSQFTSLATYAQIAQEQVEMARSEARATTERSEQRLTSLIERERADRLSSPTGQSPAGGSSEHVETLARLDALERSITEIRRGLDQSLQRQKALADAITAMFEWLAPRRNTTEAVETSVAAAFAPPPCGQADASPSTPLAPPSLMTSITTPPVAPASGPIAALSLEG
jgi:hypothetical protein